MEMNDAKVTQMKELLKDMYPADSGDMFDKFSYGKPEEKKRFREAADLGLAAMENMGADTGDEPEDEEEQDWVREWFLFEDQTIGMGMIADYINQGHSAEEASKVIDKVNDLSYSDHHMIRNSLTELENGVIFDIQAGDWNGSLKRFAEECEFTKCIGNPKIYFSKAPEKVRDRVHDEFETLPKNEQDKWYKKAAKMEWNDAVNSGYLERTNKQRERHNMKPLTLADFEYEHKNGDGSQDYSAELMCARNKYKYVGKVETANGETRYFYDQDELNAYKQNDKPKRKFTFGIF